MAEVSLTIGGVDKEHLQAAGVEISYNEVTLTRRVFRDGGSEYFFKSYSVSVEGYPTTLHGHRRRPFEL